MDQDKICLTKAEMQTMLDEAAHRGAKSALASIGLADERAAEDMKDLRNWLRAWHFAKKEVARAFLSQLVKVVLIAGATIVGAKYSGLMKFIP